MVNMVRTVEVAEVPMDRQGRVVIPRHLRGALGAVPGTVRIREVDGGLLLEAPVLGDIDFDTDDGLPVLRLGEPVSNAEVVAAIHEERGGR